MKNILFEAECYQAIGICMKIHNKLGPGFREVVYKDALELEFKSSRISYEREKKYKVTYDGITLPHFFIADFIIFDKIILEIKAATFAHPDYFSQTLNYLKSSSLNLGILVNFGMPKLTFKRIILT